MGSQSLHRVNKGRLRKNIVDNRSRIPRDITCHRSSGCDRKKIHNSNILHDLLAVDLCLGCLLGWKRIPTGISFHCQRNVTCHVSTGLRLHSRSVPNKSQGSCHGCRELLRQNWSNVDPIHCQRTSEKNPSVWLYLSMG